MNFVFATLPPFAIATLYIPIRRIYHIAMDIVNIILV
jgi:hypothetical protein